MNMTIPGSEKDISGVPHGSSKKAPAAMTPADSLMGLFADMFQSLVTPSSVPIQTSLGQSHSESAHVQPVLHNQVTGAQTGHSELPNRANGSGALHLAANHSNLDAGSVKGGKTPVIAGEDSKHGGDSSNPVVRKAADSVSTPVNVSESLRATQGVLAKVRVPAPQPTPVKATVATAKGPSVGREIGSGMAHHADLQQRAHDPLTRQARRGAVDGATPPIVSVPDRPVARKPSGAVTSASDDGMKPTSDSVNSGVLRPAHGSAAHWNVPVTAPPVHWTGQSMHQTIVPAANAQSSASVPTISMLQPNREQALNDVVVQQVQAGHNEIKIQIHPEGLGNIVIAVTKHDNGIQLQMVANHMSTMQWLTQQSNQIADAVRHSGMDVSGVQISFGRADMGSSSGGQTPRRQKQDYAGRSGNVEATSGTSTWRHTQDYLDWRKSEISIQV